MNGHIIPGFQGLNWNMLSTSMPQSVVQNQVARNGGAGVSESGGCFGWLHSDNYIWMKLVYLYYIIYNVKIIYYDLKKVYDASLYFNLKLWRVY